MRVEQHFGIKRLDESAWRALEPPDFPFFDYEFLLALERSRSVGRRTGWSPTYLTCEHEGRVLGAMPLYLKTDSYGEYVFDWSWANAFHQNGLSYYPKLVCAVPFTPATGPRLLVRPDADRAAVGRVLLDAARAHGRAAGCYKLQLSADDPQAFAFYEAAGLEAAARTYEQYLDDERRS